jgi:hypothetical protein
VARQYKNSPAKNPHRSCPEVHARAMREIPRESEVIELFKKLVAVVPLAEIRR